RATTRGAKARTGNVGDRDSISSSPRMVAQRQQIDALFGSATQAREAREPGQAVQGGSVAHSMGLPQPLSAGIEALSGMDMSSVRVHRNSDKPAQLNALAYAQGPDIHL